MIGTAAHLNPQTKIRPLPEVAAAVLPPTKTQKINHLPDADRRRRSPNPSPKQIPHLPEAVRVCSPLVTHKKHVGSLKLFGAAAHRKPQNMLTRMPRQPTIPGPTTPRFKLGDIVERPGSWAAGPGTAAVVGQRCQSARLPALRRRGRGAVARPPWQGHRAAVVGPMGRRGKAIGPPGRCGPAAESQRSGR